MRGAVAAVLAALAMSSSVSAAPNVVASIKPIHSLVALVMGDVGTPTLLVRGAASPHTYALRPSDAAALEAANLVFWTGHGLELFLEGPLATLATRATVVELAEAPGIELLPIREGGAFEPHEDEPADAGDAHAHDEEEGDLHVWLDPQNARLMVAAIATALSAADPEHAAAYAANAARASAELDALTAELAATLAPVANRPFIVFHDAYHYFERRFGLTVVGSVTVTPDVMPGARRVGELRDKILMSGAACVFAEPNFQPAVIGAIIEGTPARAGVLDPEGANLAEGPGLYAELLRGLARALVDCLAR